VCNLLRKSGDELWKNRGTSSVMLRTDGSIRRTPRSWFAYSPHVARLNHLRFARSVFLGEQQPGRTRVRRQAPRGRVEWLSRSLLKGPSSGPAARCGADFRHPHLGQRPWTEPLRLQAPTSPRHTPCAQPPGLSPVPLSAPPRILELGWEEWELMRQHCDIFPAINGRRNEAGGSEGLGTGNRNEEPGRSKEPGDGDAIHAGEPRFT
jgi:hypothetical protein